MKPLQIVPELPTWACSMWRSNDTSQLSTRCFTTSFCLAHSFYSVGTGLLGVIPMKIPFTPVMIQQWGSAMFIPDSVCFLFWGRWSWQPFIFGVALKADWLSFPWKKSPLVEGVLLIHPSHGSPVMFSDVALSIFPLPKHLNGFSLLLEYRPKSLHVLSPLPRHICPITWPLLASSAIYPLQCMFHCVLSMLAFLSLALHVLSSLPPLPPTDYPYMIPIHHLYPKSNSISLTPHYHFYPVIKPGLSLPCSTFTVIAPYLCPSEHCVVCHSVYELLGYFSDQIIKSYLYRHSFITNPNPGTASWSQVADMVAAWFIARLG